MAAQQQRVAASQAGAATPKVEYSLSGGLLERLSSLKASLAFTSYQSGFLYMLGAGPIHYIGAGVRLTFDGFGEDEWLIKPHLMVAWDNVYQSGMTVGDGTTAFVTDKGNFDRTTFGYGLTMDHQWTDKTRIHAGLSGYHYVGDTQIGFNSTFVNNNGATSFITTGEDIRNQYVVESGIEHTFGQGWSLSADAFAEFGDLQAYGGLLKLTKRF